MLRPVLTRRTGKSYDTIEARTGRVIEAAEKQTLTLVLKDGRVLHHAPAKGAPAIVRFNTLTIPVIHEEGGAFRPRGADERELTLAELAAIIADDEQADPRFSVELHMRLIRAVSIIVFPLLAFSACVGPPRRARMYGPGLAAAGVLTYHFLLFGIESLAVGAGKLAMPVLWTPFLTMALVLFLVFRSKAGRYGPAKNGGAARVSQDYAPAIAGADR
jgi:lipopolysaccharide export system permease protein